MKEHETQRHAASAAVIRLRKALGMTQQRFAVEELKSALNTVARYETTNPPRGDALLRLREIARKKGLHEIQDEFQMLYLDDLLASLDSSSWWTGRKMKVFSS